MASSSSDSASASFHQPKHEVFLSFRGEDTRNNFLYHLYEAFRRKGVGVYADFEELPRGEDISHALLQAIEESMISVIVFSQNYATSSWCLEELSKIMECRDSRRQLVVPIFYHVSPSDIRKQTGSFGTAFVEHDKNRMDKVQGWRLALTQAGKLSGFTLAGDRPEPKVIKDIVRDIVNKLTWLSKSDYKGFIGIGSRMEQIKSLLCIGGEDVRIIGIWGMGGIGKTTLAQVLYYEVIDKFESHYFMANVREELGKHSATSLRRRLLSKLLNDKSLHIDTPTIVPTSIRRRLRRKRVFVVLDDVDKFDQLEKLGISHVHFGFGSRIIVTARDKQVLTNGSIDEIYEVKELSYTNSLQLFCSFAFKQNHPAGDFKDLTNSFLKYAKGVPLALQVLGSALHKKDMAYWESELNKLKQWPHPEIQKVLEISYDALDKVDKEMFLDIAIFFKGCNRDSVRKILDSCYNFSAYSGINKLIDKCLLNVTKENNLGMHDLIQEMGRNVVPDQSLCPEERRRLWTQDDVRQVLENGEGTKSIQGMLLDQSQIGEIQLHPDAFARMRGLRIIKFYGYGGKLVPPNRSLESLPNELRCLHWDYYIPKSLPSKFHPEKLVELRLGNSEVEQLWNGKQNLANLRVLDLYRCNNLTRISDLSVASNIEELSIGECKSLVELPSLIHLKHLRSNLTISYCYNLKKFPQLPQHITHLFLGRTAIEEIPDSISNLDQLQELMLRGSRVKAVSKNINKLESLSTFELSDCPISLFPEVPRNLKRLDLNGNQIEEMPSSIGCLNRLDFLDMSRSRIHNLSSTIVQLDALHYFSLYNCPNISKFPNVPENILDLNLSGTAIEEVPSSISRLKSLLRLRMSNCRKLKSIPTSISELKYLRYLYLSKTAIEEMPPSISELKNLVRLIMSGCAKLKSLPKSICCKPGFRCWKRKDRRRWEADNFQHWFMFDNCFKLDQDAVNNIVASTQLRLQCVALEFTVGRYIRRDLDTWTSEIRQVYLFSCFPGSEIPETFKDRSTNSSITVQLSPACSSKRLAGFGLCVVADFKHNQERGLRGQLRVDYKVRFKTDCGDHHKFGSRCPRESFDNIIDIESNHVMVWFQPFQSGIVGTSRDNHFYEASFDFSVKLFYYPSNIKEQIEVQKCGVNLLYVDDKEVEPWTSDWPEALDPTNDEAVESSSWCIIEACSNYGSAGEDLEVESSTNYLSDGEEDVGPTNKTKEPSCDANWSFIQDEENRCDASMSEPNSALGPNGLSLNCDVNNRDLEEDANDEEGLGDDPTNDEEVEYSPSYLFDDEEAVDLTNETLEPCCDWSFIQDEENRCDASMLKSYHAIDPNWLSLSCDVKNYRSDGEEAVDPTNEALEPCCDANSLFIQGEENRCDASMSEPNFALGPNRLSLNCDVNNRDLEEDANDEEGLGDHPTSVKIISSSIARYFLCCFNVS